MTLLAVLLAINAVLHGAIVARFGVRGNVAYLVFTFIYAVLAVAVFLVVPHAVRATFLLTAFGLIGLTVTFGKLKRDKTLDGIIWGLDAITLVYAGYFLFVA